MDFALKDLSSSCLLICSSLKKDVTTGSNMVNVTSHSDCLLICSSFKTDVTLWIYMVNDFMWHRCEDYSEKNCQNKRPFVVRSMNKVMWYFRKLCQNKAKNYKRVVYANKEKELTANENSDKYLETTFVGFTRNDLKLWWNERIIHELLKLQTRSWWVGCSLIIDSLGILVFANNWHGKVKGRTTNILWLINVNGHSWVSSKSRLILKIWLKLVTGLVLIIMPRPFMSWMSFHQVILIFFVASGTCRLFGRTSQPAV